MHAFTDVCCWWRSELSVDDHLGERQGLQDRKGSLPPRHPGSLTPVSPGARQPSPRASQGILLSLTATAYGLLDKGLVCLAWLSLRWPVRLRRLETHVAPYHGLFWAAGLASVEDLGHGAMHRLHSERLQSERQEWHADLDSLLEGNFASEDLDLAITLAKCVPPRIISI